MSKGVKKTHILNMEIVNLHLPDLAQLVEQTTVGVFRNR